MATLVADDNRTSHEHLKCFNGPVIYLDVDTSIGAELVFATLSVPDAGCYSSPCLSCALRVSAGSQPERMIIEILSVRSLS